MRKSEAAPLLVIILITLTHSHNIMCLTTNFYQKSCPDFDKIMEETTTNKQITSPTTAAGTLRLFFHDCFHSGCDASILLSSTPFNKSERDADINLSLPGDAFDLIIRAKTALELRCPNTVSCSDILAVSARNLLVMSGGPHYPVLLGRRDSTSSSASSVKNKLPLPTMSVTNLILLFASAGFSVEEMVALTGGHTLGFSHCKEFSSDIYNYSSHYQSDPSYNPRFAAGLRNACAGFKKNPTLSVFNDIMSPNKFDNMYYKNLQKGLGLLASDRALVSDSRTRAYVETYAKDENEFFSAFSKAMQKLSVRGVKTGKSGEIRRRCDAVN